ncbi:MAG: response regulator transcription factor [Lachnospiraceae bacterium]|nr:response regulator transcription factor [Lachnospiraceae bacterium]
MALVYVVEDDNNIQEIEEIILKSNGHTVSCFDSSVAFYKQLEEKVPDLVILDIMLPDEDGYSVVKRLRQNFRTMKVPIIMVTAKTSEIDMVKGLDMGADDYIKKPFSVIEFITRVKAVLRRTMSQENNKFIKLGNIFIDDERHMAYVSDKPVELTFKEYELLKFLMKNKGIVMSREQIMQKVWDTDFEGETRTVDMHIKTLRKKLGDESSHVKTVRNVGYVME